MHNLNPKFSIITVTYNAEKVIENTILSIIEQTYHNIEYIIIDGASKDKTINIIEKYRPQIKTVVSEPDNGLYDAMNKGIALAKGDYLCFLNAGDCFHQNDTLKKIVSSLSTDTLPDIIYGETEIVNGQGTFLHRRRLSAPEKLTWKSFKHGMLVCHQAFFAKRSLVDPYDLRYLFSSDFDWCIRIMKKSKIIHNTHLVVIDYLEEGITTQHHKASLIERFRIMNKHYGLLSTIVQHMGFVLRSFNK
ncbi:MAG: glycosyltransferase [Bacteroidaceae bacterium]|nr:glycosyltransferase [Bacteroidaceae bacterium]